MNLYSEMGGIPGTSSQADEPVQRELKRLLRHLRWSYAALWSFNHQTSNLRWRGGHFRGNSDEFTLRGDIEVWNEYLFNSTYKSCTFASGQGSVGTAYAETRNIWMNGPSIHCSAGSKEQAQFLIDAGIKTAVCIPWGESVLEVGTCETVAENLELTADMFIFLSEHILPALTQAPPDFTQTSLAVSRATMQSSPFPSLNFTRHLSNEFVAQGFELSSLDEQIRSLSSSNAGMFLLHPDEGESRKQLTSGLETGGALIDPRWRSPTTTTSRAADIQMQKPKLDQASMNARSAQYRPQSGTTSSSVIGSQDELSRPGFKVWRRTQVQAPALQRFDCTNQVLLRRSFEMMKWISLLGSRGNLQGPQLASSSTSPEIDLPEIGCDDTFDQNAPLRGQRRAPRGAKPAPAGSGQDDAATSHMLAERRRRIRQKENFTSLRKVVPIISKADKASILGDAVLYIKDLQERVSEMQSRRAETESRYENLKKAHQELEQRNKELETTLAAGHGGEASSSQLQKPEDNPGREGEPLTRQFSLEEVKTTLHSLALPENASQAPCDRGNTSSRQSF